jgi:hypothetical protein
VEFEGIKFQPDPLLKRGFHLGYRIINVKQGEKYNNKLYLR